MAQIIPLSSAPNQTLTAPLNINGGTVTVQLSANYNRVAGFWMLSIYDSTGTLLVTPIPLLTGVWPAANILMPFQYLNVGSAFVINASGTTVDYPNSTDLGTDFLLLWDNNTDYVPGIQFGGNVIIVGPQGPAGPTGPTGAPGAPGTSIGGLYNMGTSGTLTPSPAFSQFTNYANLVGNANINPPSPLTAGQVFIIELTQPSGGGCVVTWNSFYKGTFPVDTTGNTRAVVWVQVASDAASGSILFSQNGIPIS